MLVTRLRIGIGAFFNGLVHFHIEDLLVISGLGMCCYLKSKNTEKIRMEWCSLSMLHSGCEFQVYRCYSQVNDKGHSVESFLCMKKRLKSCEYEAV